MIQQGPKNSNLIIRHFRAETLGKTLWRNLIKVGINCYILNNIDHKKYVDVHSFLNDNFGEQFVKFVMDCEAEFD